MGAKCANQMCSSHRDEGKLFRLDIDIGNGAGENQRKTIWVWLCEVCARRMVPRIEVAGSSVLVRLGAIAPAAVRSGRAPAPRVN